MNKDNPLSLETPIEDIPKASSISPTADESKPVEFEEALSVIKTFFEESSYLCGKNYTDGFNIELLRDDLDIVALISSLVRISFDQLRQAEELSDKDRIYLSHLYTSIDSQLKIVKGISDKNVAHNVILCKIIGYCLKNYQRYNTINKHD